MRWFTAILLVSFLALATRNEAEAEEGSDGFLILTVLFKNNQFTVVNQRLVKEQLKAARPHLQRGELLTFSFENTNRVSVANIEIPHPAFQHVEVEDPEHAGSLKAVEVVQPEVEFLIRVPFVKGIKHLSIFQHSPAARNTLKVAVTKTKVGDLDLDGDAVR